MRLKHLNRIYITILVLFMIWIPIHRYLVVKYDLNPWKLGGLAMFVDMKYSKISVKAYKNGQLTDIDQKKLSSENKFGQYKLYNKFDGLGRLYNPSNYLQTIRNELEVDSLILIFTDTGINPKTGKMVSKDYRYVAK